MEALIAMGGGVRRDVGTDWLVDDGEHAVGGAGADPHARRGGQQVVQRVDQDPGRTVQQPDDEAGASPGLCVGGPRRR